MKTSAKIACLSSVVIFIFLTSHTQGQLSRSTIGIKGGLNVAHLSVRGISDESNHIGYHFGAFARLGLTKNFAIQPEALFAVKGAKLNFNNAFVTGGAVISLKYIDIPVLAVFNITDHLNVHLGPYGSYLIDVAVKNKSDSEGADFESEISKDNFKRMDYGLAAGVGLEFRSLNLGIRYLKGLSEVGEDKMLFGQLYNFPDGKNEAWQLYVGLSFF